jgi:1,4-alpha-glucan branching enzyme
MYGGSNMGNAGGLRADGPPAHGFPVSLRVTLPPLGFLLLKKGG